MNQIGPQISVGILGYSLGTRTVAVALDGLSRGEVAGQPLPDRPDVARQPLRVVFLAAAQNNTWLLPEGQYSLASTQFERALVTVNPRDRLLRYFVRVLPTNALGARGLPADARSAELRMKVEQFVVTPWVGTAHRWLRYTRSPEIMSRVRSYLFDFESAAVDGIGKSSSSARTNWTGGEPNEITWSL
jgi:hypothetical protein